MLTHHLLDAYAPSIVPLPLVQWAQGNQDTATKPPKATGRGSDRWNRVTY